MAPTVKNKQFMELAIELAVRGFGAVEPNPMVGCVIVKDGKVIGEGWHKEFGGAHAEINALSDCRKSGFEADGATMCVTLEPCCHQGKTPPCTEAIIEAGIAKVVVAMEDPTEKVGGQGIRQLQNAGVKVTLGVCEKQARLLNPGFVRFARSGRPWVIVKWAQTIDGKLATIEGSSGERWISGEKSRKDAHKIRRSVQAVLVGVNTVIADDPLLTPRPDKGRKPVRIVLDSNLRLPIECRLLGSLEQGQVIVVTTQKAVADNVSKSEEIKAAGAELVAGPENGDGRCDIDFLLDDLGRRGVQRLLVEGGPTVIESFLRESLADELIVYIAPKILGAGGAADISQSMSRLEFAELNHTTTCVFGEDVRIRGFLTSL